MTTETIYLDTGVILIAIGLIGLAREPHLLRKILAINVGGSGIFLLLVTLAARGDDDAGTDPVPHAMVLTGIVVAVSATAVGLALAKKYHRQTGRSTLPGEDDE